MTRDQAYRHTLYRAGDVAVRVGRRCPEVHARQAWFIGAWNPFSRKMPDRWNDAAHARLLRDVRALPFREGEGSLGGWRERMLLVIADSATVFRLACRYRQAAVVLVPRGRPARLVYSRSLASKWAFTSQ
ncbi:MAG: hypothetical protein JWR10_4302 [Rubritepida sp.]|nr:hypothetical protein [Rubritepida sp.]